MPGASFITPIRALTARRVVSLALFAGLLTGLLLALIDNPIAPVARALIAWDVGILIYLASAFWLLHDATPDDMARHAADARPGRHFVLLVAVAGVVVSIAVLGFEVRAINLTADRWQNLRVAFVLATVAFSWLFVHTSFATHYAFEYYGRGAGETRPHGGLAFPDDRQPDFWDVWNFAVVIGITSATADVNITSRTIRRVASIHGIIAFMFNTIILATTINFAGELFEPRASASQHAP